MNYKEIVLRKYLKGVPSEIMPDERLIPYLLGALDEYGRDVVKEALMQTDKPKRRIMGFIFGVYVKTTWDGFILLLRAKNLRLYKKMVQILSNENRRKYYIVRSSEIGYKTFSSADVKLNKKLRIFGKEVDAIKLHETADAIICPM
jgi:hypothetical protein